MARSGGIAFGVGPGGWVHADWGDGRAYFRFEPTEERWVLAEISVPNPTQAVLRSIPIAKIEAAVNAGGAIGDERQQRLAFSFRLRLRLGEEVPPDLTRRPPPTRNQPGTRGYFETAHASRFRLKRPSGRRLDDDFYRDVARAYHDAVLHGLNPREALAEDTGAKDATVAAWVMEARKPERGYLPKTSQGKARA